MMIITSAGQIYLRVAFSKESRLKKNHADMHNGEGGKNHYFVTFSHSLTYMLFALGYLIFSLSI